MSDSDEDWDIENEEDDFSQPIHIRQRSFTILTFTDMSYKLQSLVDEYSEMLEISKDESLILLNYYKWKPYKLQEDWFENESLIRIKAGILEQLNTDTTKTRGKKLGSLKLVKGTQGCCQICFESLAERDALMCGHVFCCNCWRSYIEDLIRQNSIVEATCPSFGCMLKIPESMVLKYAEEEMKEKYVKLKCCNFITMSQMYKFCPFPGCEYIAECSYMGTYEITCNCDFVFCFGCGEEAHRPTLCHTVKEWNTKNSAESENINWILANTKQCPSCRKPIEKNQGCNHMTCYREIGGCGYEFCWLCSGKWSEHSSTTGGYYKCNKYEELVAKNEALKCQETQRKSDKTELGKYMWYFERYNNHSKAQILAKDKQIGHIEKKMQQLHDIKQYPIGEVEFLKSAVEQVIRCRRVLKWTYVFGYYLGPGLEKNLFEHLQEKLEENTDHLHELVEKPLDEFLDVNNTDKSKFYHYKSDLTNYFQVTKQFFENLLDGIENGLTT
ncbi:hypothetical protein SteCoe_27758 [Stentor coeruleus]|uniref:RBR-type E3 ubiquitin transferase n=1 Tax=Stentor coeruleus TaxID=5963 RepID=A0A1R2B9T9_9CILI|nr:hypothetical protein SteCoe_27758 [Stentor coeruleus]